MSFAPALAVTPVQVGLLRAQLASTQAQVLALQAEAQPAGPAGGAGGDSTGPAAAELVAHAQARADGLQLDLQAALARAAEAETGVADADAALAAARDHGALLEQRLQAAEARLQVGPGLHQPIGWLCLQGLVQGFRSRACAMKHAAASPGLEGSEGLLLTNTPHLAA